MCPVIQIFVERFISFANLHVKVHLLTMGDLEAWLKIHQNVSADNKLTERVQDRNSYPVLLLKVLQA